jgi:hypothetical protein
VHQGKAQQEAGKRDKLCPWPRSPPLSTSSHAIFPDANACNYECNRLFGIEHEVNGNQPDVSTRFSPK